jgi:hypothetical protein
MLGIKKKYYEKVFKLCFSWQITSSNDGDDGRILKRERNGKN